MQTSNFIPRVSLMGFIAAIGLAAMPCLSAEDAYVANEVIICFKADVTEEARDAFAKNRGMAMKKRLKPVQGRKEGLKENLKGRPSLGLYTHAGKSTKELLAAVRNQPEVLYAEPNYYRTLFSSPNDSKFPLLWGLHNTGQTVNGVSGSVDSDIDYPEAMKLVRPTADDVVVAVADTGVNIQHPDLSDQMWVNPLEIPGNGIDDDANGYVDDIVGYDFGTNVATMVDNHGHGTHVAGSIGAVTNNEVGVTGVANRVKLMALKVADSNNNLTAAGIVESLYYAADLKSRGVDLVAINASYGSSSASQSEYAAISALNDLGVLICAAAGNDGTNNDSSPFYPTNYNLPNIISVAASNQYNSLAGFSNYGSSTVDLAAPGSNILSAMPLGQTSPSASLSVGDAAYSVGALEFSGVTTVSGIQGEVISCGLGYAGDFPAAVDGNIALIERGEIYFSQKVQNAMNAGATAALIYDNVSTTSGTWTLGSAGNWIPAMQLSRSDGQAILSSLPRSADLTVVLDTSEAYVFQNGTSMAAPHVAGAVAFTSVNFPNDTMAELKARILNNVMPVSGLNGKVSTGGVLNLQKIIDSDGDSLPDWWEEDEIGSLSLDGSLDSDGDGYSDYAEYLSMTDPNSASSFFRYNSLGFQTGQGMVFKFPSVSGRIYQLYGNDDLSSTGWLPIGGEIIGTGGIIEVADPESLSKSKRFYRLELR